MLRAECEAHRIGYVLAIGCDRRIPTPAGLVRADALAESLPQRAWQRVSAGPGAKGQRYYDWAWVTLSSDDANDDTNCWWLLIRRHPTTGELAFYRCYAPPRTWSRCASWSASLDVAAATPARRTGSASRRRSTSDPGG